MVIGSRCVFVVECVGLCLSWCWYRCQPLFRCSDLFAVSVCLCVRVCVISCLPVSYLTLAAARLLS